MFTLQTEYYPAGHEHLEPATGGEEVRQRWSCLEQPLEVVQHEEQPPLPQVPPQRLVYALPRAMPDPKRLGDSRWDQGRVANRGQRDEAYPVLELGRDSICYLEAKSGLADPAWTRERQQAHVRAQQPLLRLRQHPLASDKRGGLRG